MIGGFVSLKRKILGNLKLDNHFINDQVLDDLYSQVIEQSEKTGKSRPILRLDTTPFSFIMDVEKRFHQAILLEVNKHSESLQILETKVKKLKAIIKIYIHKDENHEFDNLPEDDRKTMLVKKEKVERKLFKAQSKIKKLTLLNTKLIEKLHVLRDSLIEELIQKAANQASEESIVSLGCEKLIKLIALEREGKTNENNLILSKDLLEPYTPQNLRKYGIRVNDTTLSILRLLDAHIKQGQDIIEAIDFDNDCQNSQVALVLRYCSNLTRFNLNLGALKEHLVFNDLTQCVQTLDGPIKQKCFGFAFDGNCLSDDEIKSILINEKHSFFVEPVRAISALNGSFYNLISEVKLKLKCIQDEIESIKSTINSKSHQKRQHEDEALQIATKLKEGVPTSTISKLEASRRSHVKQAKRLQDEITKLSDNLTEKVDQESRYDYNGLIRYKNACIDHLLGFISNYFPLIIIAHQKRFLSKFLLRSDEGYIPNEDFEFFNSFSSDAEHDNNDRESICEKAIELKDDVQDILDIIEKLSKLYATDKKLPGIGLEYLVRLALRIQDYKSNRSAFILKVQGEDPKVNPGAFTIADLDFDFEEEWQSYNETLEVGHQIGWPELEKLVIYPLRYCGATANKTGREYVALDRDRSNLKLSWSSIFEEHKELRSDGAGTTGFKPLKPKKKKPNGKETGSNGYFVKRNGKVRLFPCMKIINSDKKVLWIYGEERNTKGGSNNGNHEANYSVIDQNQCTKRI